MTDSFSADDNPADFTVDQVTTYLATATPEEAERVKSLEAAVKARKGIVEFVQDPDTVPESEDGYTRVPVAETEAYVPGTPVVQDFGPTDE